MHWPWFWELDISGKLTHCSMAYVSRAVVNVFAYCNYIDLTKTEVHELTKPYITLALIHNSLNTALEYIYPFLEFTRSSICLTQIRFISCNCVYLTEEIISVIYFWSLHHTLLKKMCLKVSRPNACWSLLPAWLRNQLRASSPHSGSIAKHVHSVSTWSKVNPVSDIIFHAQLLK